MLLSGISIPLFGLVDTAILGHLEDPIYLASVALGASVVNFLLWGLGFLRMGTTSLAARRYGQQQFQALNLLLGQALLLSLLLGLLLLLLSPWLIPAAVELMQAETKLGPLSEEYIGIRLLAAPASLMLYAIIGWFIGLHNTRVPLYLALLINGVNIALDYWFIIGLDMASRGAAWASVGGELCGLALGLHLVWRQLGRRLPNLSGLLQWRAYAELLRVNRHLFVRTLVLLGTLSFFTAMGARQGADILAANAILLQLVHLCAYALDGFAHATEAMAGRAYGRAKLDEFYLALKASGLWSLLVAAALVVAFYLAREPLIALFSDQQSLNDTVRRYYLWVIALPLASASCYYLDGVFIGAGLSRDMQITMILACTLVFLPLWWLCQPLGNHGLWLAFCAFNGARGLFLGLQFFRHHQRGWGLKA